MISMSKKLKMPSDLEGKAGYGQGKIWFGNGGANNVLKDEYPDLVFLQQSPVISSFPSMVLRNVPRILNIIDKKR